MSRNEKKIYNSFLKDGYFNFKTILNRKNCLQLRKFIDMHRPCSDKIFYKSKKEFLRNSNFKNYSPGEKDHNAIFNLNLDLDFIEKSKNFIKAVEFIAGKNYK